MPGEGQFQLGCENPHAPRVARILRRKNESCLGEVEFACERLHGPIGHPPRVWKDRELVPPKGGLRKNVGNDESVGHDRVRSRFYGCHRREQDPNWLPASSGAPVFYLNPIPPRKAMFTAV